MPKASLHRLHQTLALKEKHLSTLRLAFCWQRCKSLRLTNVGKTHICLPRVLSSQRLQSDRAPPEAPLGSVDKLHIELWHGRPIHVEGTS